MTQVIAITGASGFIGGAIAHHLLQHDFALRLLVRDPQKPLPAALQGAELVPGDLASQASLEQLVKGADAVIHCAGSVRGASQAQFDQANVAGTSNLLRAISSNRQSQNQSNRARLLFFSSLAAREPQLSYYAASKHRAEQVVREEGHDIAWTIVRPPAVYGPGDRELLPLFRLMGRGFTLTAGAPTARFSIIHVDDVAAAASAWLDNATAPPQCYALDDGQTGGYNWLELSQIVSKICHRPVRVIQAPSWLMDSSAWLNTRLAAITGRAPMLTAEKLRELRHRDWVCSSRPFQQDLNWQPQVPLAKGLRATPGWSGYAT